MVVRGRLRVRTLISITSKSALAATIALVLAGCENKAPETRKPVSTAPVFSPENLAQRTIERRAVEDVIWGMPAVNFDPAAAKPSGSFLKNSSTSFPSS
jgi:hypothetical protein